MIEQKLKTIGVSEEELDSFAKLRRHNEKEDVFREIASVGNINNLGGDSNLFLIRLSKVLREEGEQRWRFKPEMAAQLLASRILGTLRTPKKYGNYEYLRLDQLYQDTLELNRKLVSF